MKFELNNVKKNNYKYTTIGGKQIRIHRFVMQKHLGRELLSSELVHHKDGNKHNNDITNLEIVSRARHALLHKDSLKTAQKHNTKHNVDLVELKNLYEQENLSASLISKILKIPKPTINWLIRKHGLKHSPIFCSICGTKANGDKKSKLCRKHYSAEYYRENKDKWNGY